MVNALGVTGGIGSGKSLACRYLSALGADVFEADKVARRLMERPGEVRLAIERRFGRGSYLPGGSLNSRWLAERVFGQPDELAQLNAIVHPAVHEAFDQARSLCSAPLLVSEAALIYESGMEDRLDAVAVIAAPEADRVRRVMERDKMSRKQVRQRMVRQLPQEELERRADVVIVNAGDANALRRKVITLYELATSAERMSRDTFRLHHRL